MTAYWNIASIAMLSFSFHHLPPLTFQSFISESNQIFTSANELPCLSDLHCTRKLNHWQRKRLLNLMISHKLLATVNFKPPPPLTFQIFISESNHIFTLAFEQSCFLSFLIQEKLTTHKEKAAQFNDLTKKQGSLYGLKSPSYHHRQWVHRRSHLIS